MKDKLLKLLKESKVADDVATIISETVDEKFTTLQRENASLTAKLNESESLHKTQINKINENWKAIHQKTKEEVKKTLKEDYEPFKVKLTTKVKNFLKENINSFKTVIKEQVEDDLYKGSASQKLESIAEAVQPLFNGGKVDESKTKALIEESKELKKTLDEVSEASKQLEKKLETRDRQTRLLVNENKKLKVELDKPLKEQVGDVKVAKETIDENKQVIEEQKDSHSDAMNEMLYLAGETL